MKVFISQPMRGLDTKEILEVREEVFNEYKKRHPDAELIPSFMTDGGKFWDEEESPHPQLRTLGQSIAFMSDADVLLLVQGWEMSPGCRVEQKVARYYGIQIDYAR